MKLHTLDPKVAERVGANAAIIYQNFVFWCEKNLANRRHIMDGYVWTYNSRRAMSEMFSYLSESQIKTALLKLVEEGLLIKGDYNIASYDRTNWYAPAESAEWISAIGQKSPMDRSEIANALVKNRQPIPDSKPVLKPDSKPDLFGSDSQQSSLQRTESPNTHNAEHENSFQQFWAVYPKAGKQSKDAAVRAFKKAIKRASADEIIAGAKRYAAWLASGRPGEFRPQVKHAQGWLNDSRWTDESIPELAPPPDNAERIRVLLANAAIDRDLGNPGGAREYERQARELGWRP